jgi:hypothetical protein
MEFMNDFKVGHGAALPLPMPISSYAFSVLDFVSTLVALSL